MENITKDFRLDLIDFDDGQKPGGTTVATKLAIYHNKNQSDFFTVFDSFLPDEWCHRAYSYIVEKGSPWEEARSSSAIEDAEELWKEGKFEKAIALRAVRALLIDRGGSLIGNDLDILHGTAVWSLSSTTKDEVKYHIDYGELYRYETNIIYPPVYAGTCQVSPVHNDADMIGGAFRANIDGIKHYQRFGYKCRLASEEEFIQDTKSSKWITVPYHYNRATLHDGNYPHYATEIEYIRPGLKRVILGFNCFTKELAECNLRAPEHSDAFNRTIKLYQKMAAMGIPVTNAVIDSKYDLASPHVVDDSEGRRIEGNDGLGESVEEKGEKKKEEKEKKRGIHIEDIKKNPILAKMLIKAAKTMKQNNTNESQSLENS